VPTVTDDVVVVVTSVDVGSRTGSVDDDVVTMAVVAVVAGVGCAAGAAAGEEPAPHPVATPTIATKPSRRNPWHRLIAAPLPNPPEPGANATRSDTLRIQLPFID
jgi:hypothetical protein